MNKTSICKTVKIKLPCKQVLALKKDCNVSQGERFARGCPAWCPALVTEERIKIPLKGGLSTRQGIAI